MNRKQTRDVILWVWIIPLATFGLAMVLWPRYRPAILAAEIASPIPPFP